jgi:hypothetical protein
MTALLRRRRAAGLPPAIAVGALLVLLALLEPAAAAPAGPGGPGIPTPAGDYVTLVEEAWVTEPVSNVRLYTRVLQPDPALYPGRRFPAVVVVPGGNGDGAPMATQPVYQELASRGMIVVAFNAPGRGSGQPGNLRSEGSEDCNGFAGQNALKAVVEFAGALPNVDPANLGIQTSSYGITLGAGALGRYPSLPVRYLVDLEGPSNNLITTFYYRNEILFCGHWSLITDPSPQNQAWWAEREAYRFIGAYRGYYLRMQAVTDHAQPPGIYTHTLEMNNAAVQGGLPWTRVNGREMGNALNTLYLASRPLWLPGRLADYPLLAAAEIADMANRFGAAITPTWGLGLQIAHDVDREDGGLTLVTSAQLTASRILAVDPAGRVTGLLISSLRFAHNADRLANGNTVVSDTGNDRVVELDPEGLIVWNSALVPLSDGSRLRYPNDANALAGDHLLITDRDNHRVLEIDRAGQVLWQFGVTGVPGSDLSHLNGPHNADRLANGNTLVADSNNNRVLEVTPAGTIAWLYAPTGSGALNWPRDADRLDNGNTLIVDSNNNRVLEVTPAGAVVWQFAGGLGRPYDADRLPGGNTLIADTQSGRVIEVTADGRIQWRFPALLLPWKLKRWW